MKYALLLSFVLSLVLSACVQKEVSKQPDADIKVGKIDSLFSKNLNEERRFWVYLPYGVGKTIPKGKKYPVVYLLDGDAHFLSVAGLIQQLSSVNGNTLCPEMIVVAIPNTDRTRDLTPSNDATDEWSKTSGGAENFTKFIEELIPYIEQNYPAMGYRTLIGHSFGGLFAVNTIMHHRDLFDNYLAIDPSLWWDKRKLLQESKHLLDTSRFDGKNLFVATAHTIKHGMTLEELSKDTTERTRHMRSIIEFCDYAKTKTSNGLTFNSKYYPDDGHSSVVLVSEHDALRSMFSWYSTNELDKYYSADSKEPAEELVQVITKHYEIVSARFGIPYPPPADEISELGNYFLRENRADRALALFNLNLKNYPKEISTFKSFGDFYLHEKDTAKAIDSFTTALTFGDDKDVKEKLDKLTKE